MENNKHIILVATYALLMVIVAMIAMFVVAIVDPNVDDNVVFQIVGPAFQTIVGGFIGLITGIKIGQNDGSDNN
jgi:hypothetical protein